MINTKEQKVKFVVVQGNGAYILRQKSADCMTLFDVRKIIPEVQSCVSFRSSEFSKELTQFSLGFSDARRYKIKDGDILEF